MRRPWLTTLVALSTGVAAPTAVAQVPDGLSESGATGPTGPTGPAAPASVPSLALSVGAVAPGGRLALRVGRGPAGVGVQVRRRVGWERVRTLGAASSPRMIVIRTPLKGSRVAVRLVLGERRGTERRAVLRALRLAAVGDVNLGDLPGAQIARFGPAWPWASVGPVLRAADLAFANLECAISLRGSPQKKQFTFRGRPSSLRAAARVGGLDVVSLANNHAVDFGRVALLDGLRAARAAGITPFGAGADEGSAYRPAVVERLGLRVAFVGFSEILPFEFRAGTGSPGTAWAFPDRVRASVRAARRTADVVVASFHWGVERETTENARQRALARLALDSGATAVIGAHPHVLQPTRRVGRRRVVAYSLGNFVFGARSPGTSTTRILTLGLAADGVRSVGSAPARIFTGRPVLTGGR